MGVPPCFSWFQSCYPVCSIHSYATFGFTTFVISLMAVYAIFMPGAALKSPNIIFFYLFAGLVTVVLRSLEKSTFQLRREAAESNTILSSLRGSYILTDKNYRILRLNERTLSLFPLAKLGANLVATIRDTKMEISPEDLQHLIDVVTGVETEDAQVQIRRSTIMQPIFIFQQIKSI